MNKLIIIACFFLANSSSFAQGSNADFALECGKFFIDNYSKASERAIVKVVKIKSVTLGDAGGSYDSVGVLDKYREIVCFFDNSYPDTKLINIIKRNYCPLISCYAFTALLRNESLKSGTVVTILSQFAMDTVSFVICNFGNEIREITAFEYMMHVASGKLKHDYLDGLKTLTVAEREFILIIKSKFFTKRDFSGDVNNWKAYERQFL